MTRRQLEQAIIATARVVVEVEPTDIGSVYVPLRDFIRLRDAVWTLDMLKPLSGPRTARCAPVTSHTAAKWVETLGKSLSSKIFYRIYWSGSGGSNPWATGFTTEELIIWSGIGHASVSARVNELANAGWIVDSGRTRSTYSGRDAIVWIASDAARRAVEEGRRP